MNFFKQVDVECYHGMVSFYCDNIPRLPIESGVIPNDYEEDGEGFGLE